MHVGNFMLEPQAKKLTTFYFCIYWLDVLFFSDKGGSNDSENSGKQSAALLDYL